MRNLRQLAIALLNDDEGINLNAFNILQVELTRDQDHDNTDILAAVKHQDNRVYLPQDAVIKSENQ